MQSEQSAGAGRAAKAFSRRGLMPSQPTSVRATVTGILVTLTALSAVVIAALVLLTTGLHSTTQALNDSAEQLRVVSQVDSDLLRHVREPDPAAQASLEREIGRHLANARRLGNGTSLPGLDRFVDSTARYFQANRAARDAGLTRGETVRQTAPELAAAFDAARLYSDEQLQLVHDAQTRASIWNEAANVIGVVASVAVVVVVATGLLWVRRFAFVPVQRISAAMRRFRDGELGSRARLRGPLELQRIAADFNDMAEEIAQQQQRQLAFVAGVVHDLRNPLSALQLSAARLEPGRRPLTDEQLRSTVALVRRQLKLLERMTGDLLDSARLRSGQLELHLQPSDARELARNSVDLFEIATARHRLVLSLDEQPAPVRCDPLRIEEVLNNLISNAIKYSPRGGEVRVSVETVGDEVRLAVSDQGIGIAPEDLPHIFDPFRRTGASKDTAPGVGLGLFVCRRIVEAHRGRIEVESTEGEGSTFRVRLPRLRAAQTVETLAVEEQPRAPA